MLRISSLCKWLARWLAVACLCGPLAARADDIADVQRLFSAGQPEVAMQRADLYISAHPKDPQMRFLKGVMLADTRRNAEAIDVFDKITQDYPDIAEPYNNLATLYAANGDYVRARTTLEHALRTNPSYSTAHENLGDVYAALAAQSYDRALKNDPHNATVAPKLALVKALYKRASATEVATPASAPASATSN